VQEVKKSFCKQKGGLFVSSSSRPLQNNTTPPPSSSSCVFTATSSTSLQEVKKSFSNQKVASSIPCRSVLEQDTEPLIAPDVQCAISVNVKCVYNPCKLLWIKASAKCKCKCTHSLTHTHTLT